MYVYLVWAEGTNLFKIGISGDVSARLQSLQVGCPHKLRVYAAIKDENAEKTEARLHLVFKDFQTRGEWFALPPIQIAEVLAYFMSPKTPIEQWMTDFSAKRGVDIAQLSFRHFAEGYIETFSSLQEELFRAQDMPEETPEQVEEKRRAMHASVDRLFSRKPQTS